MFLAPQNSNIYGPFSFSFLVPVKAGLYNLFFFYDVLTRGFSIALVGAPMFAYSVSE